MKLKFNSVWFGPDGFRRKPDPAGVEVSEALIDKVGAEKLPKDTNVLTKSGWEPLFVRPKDAAQNSNVRKFDKKVFDTAVKFARIAESASEEEEEEPDEKKDSGKQGTLKL